LSGPIGQIRGTQGRLCPSSLIHSRENSPPGGEILVEADRWFSAEEIAEYLGVKRDTVYK